MPTMAVVRRLFCLLKFRNWTRGRSTRMMVVTTLTHSELPQLSSVPKYMYPSALSAMAAPSKTSVKKIRMTM
jgi:hypothetical protein